MHTEIDLRAKFHGRVILLCALLLLALNFFGTISQSTFFIKNRIAAPEGFHGLTLADTTPHSSINISSNQDFILQGWPGNGNEESPYVIEALSLDFDGCCINISNTNVFFVVNGCILQNNNFDAGRYSVHFQNVTNGRVESSTIESYVAGIYLENCENCTIEQCVFDTGWWCVRLEACLSCVIVNSTLSSGNDGIWANACSNLEVALNNMSGISGEDGIIIGMCPDFIIRNNSLNGFSDEGITIYSSHNGVIANNTIRCTLGFRGFSGIELDNATNCEIAGNDVSAYAYGLDDRDSHDCIIESNSIHNNDYGIRIWQSDNCSYSKNVFLANLYSNAEDNGHANIWVQNWWDDYIGYGWYPISGSAGSFDTDPSPKNNVVIIGMTATISIVFLGCFILVVVGTRRIRRRTPINRESVDWDIKERLTLPLLITALLPTDVFLYFPAYSPSRWLILGATPFGVISWTEYPSWGHHPLEFIFPLTGDFQISLYYVLFGLLWFLLSALVVRSFWLFAGGEINRIRMKRTVHSVLVVMILLSLVTLTIPLPITPFVTLLQVSRFSNVESSN